MHQTLLPNTSPLNWGTLGSWTPGLCADSCWDRCPRRQPLDASAPHVDSTQTTFTSTWNSAWEVGKRRMGLLDPDPGPDPPNRVKEMRSTTRSFLESLRRGPRTPPSLFKLKQTITARWRQPRRSGLRIGLDLAALSKLLNLALFN